MDNEIEMSDHELLLKLVEESQRRRKIEMIRTAFFMAVTGAMLAGILIFMHKVTAQLQAYSAVFDQVSKMMNETGPYLEQFKQSVDSLDPEMLDQIKSYLESLEKIFKMFGM